MTKRTKPDCTRMHRYVDMRPERQVKPREQHTYIDCVSESMYHIQTLNITHLPFGTIPTILRIEMSTEGDRRRTRPRRELSLTGVSIELWRAVHFPGGSIDRAEHGTRTIDIS